MALAIYKDAGNNKPGKEKKKEKKENPTKQKSRQRRTKRGHHLVRPFFLTSLIFLVHTVRRVHGSHHGFVPRGQQRVVRRSSTTVHASE